MVLAQVILIILSGLSSRNTLLSVANPVSEQQENSDVCNTASCIETAQFLLNCMDTSADPCHDFSRYACGGWEQKHPIPDEKPAYSVTDVVSDEVDRRIAEILKTATNGNHIKPVIDAATIFQGCMDEDARETQGLDPLKSVINSFGGWPMTDTGWSDAGYHWQEKVAASIRTLEIGAIVGIYIWADAKESSRHIILLKQANFGLGRSELLNMTSSEHTIEIVQAYKNYIISTGKLLNPNVDETKLNNDAEELIQFESALAKFSKPPEVTKDPAFWYNKMKVSDVDKITENKHFKWVDFLNNILQDFPEVTDETQIIITDIDFIKNAIKLVHDTNPRVVANYIGWILLKQLGDHTTKPFRNNAFRYDAVVSGVEKPPKLETVCSELTVTLFGFAVGRLYVDRYFTEQEKRDVETIVEDIRAAYELTLTHNTWMDPDTKSKALEKLRAMASMMGYPEWIKNDQNLSDYYASVPHLEKDAFFMSMIKATGAVAAKTFKKWNQPTERTEWVTSPTEVNAFYYGSANSIIIPAGYLNQPFYKYGSSIAVNYGAFGAVIGHEISHGFDDTGSQYDKQGNLVDWWSKETKDQFEAKSDCFKRQYSSYVEPKTNTRLNGNKTIGDDIADNGGLRNAFLAYKARVLESQNELVFMKIERLPGLSATPEQLFFLGYATTWCGNDREENIKWNIEYDDHTLDQFRIIVPVSNSRAFAEAFNCPVGSPMNPESKCVLW